MAETTKENLNGIIGMQESLLPLLRCPVTRTALSIKILKRSEKIFEGQAVDIIDEAILYATEDWYYPLIKGIPRLNVEAFIDHEDFIEGTGIDHASLKENLYKKYGVLIEYTVKKNKRTKKSFTKEWGLYDYDKDKTWDASDAAMMDRFLTETDETADTIKSKMIFDAGCGNGKLDALIAASGAVVIGMDFSNSIEQAYEKNKFMNAHFIQGDVQYSPFAIKQFDIVHCSGVLIATNNTESSFSSIAPLVKTGGKLSVWLYHPRKDLIHNLFNGIRKVTSKLPLGFQYYLYLFTIFPVSYVVKKIKGNKQNRREMMVDILDWFSPEFRWEHEPAEAESWYHKENYNKVRVTTSNIFGFNIVGEKN